MLLTEAEAKKRWCPFVRYTRQEGQTHTPARNRWVEVSDEQLNPAPSRCIASECMAWRDVHDPYERVKSGFCGLAGKS